MIQTNGAIGTEACQLASIRETGEEQVLLQGALGGYWQYRSRVTIDETGCGQHIDWD